jgi:tetratricopeptide (TPR) repeat protein
MAVMLTAAFAVGCVSSIPQIESVKIEFQSANPDYARVEQLLTQARAENPNAGEVDVWFGRVYRRTDRYTESWNAFQTAMRKGVARSQIEPYLNQLFIDAYNRGAARLGSDMLDGAVEDLNLAIEIKPDRFEPYAMLGYAYNGVDQTKAIEMYRVAHGMEPGDLETAVGYAALLLGEKECETAIPVLEGIVATDTSETLIKNKLRLATAFGCADREAEAAAIYMQLNREAPGNPDVMYNLAAHHFNEKEYDEAINLLVQLLEIKPDDVEAILLLAQTHRNLEDLDATIADYERLIEVDPGNDAAHVDIAFIYLQLKQEPVKALEHFIEALKLNPDNYDAATFGGLAAIQAGDDDRAIALLENSVRLKTDDCDIWGTLIGLYHKNHMSAERDDAVARAQAAGCE